MVWFHWIPAPLVVVIVDFLCNVGVRLCQHERALPGDGSHGLRKATLGEDLFEPRLRERLGQG